MTSHSDDPHVPRRKPAGERSSEMARLRINEAAWSPPDESRAQRRLARQSHLLDGIARLISAVY